MSRVMRSRLLICLIILGALVALPAAASNDPMFRSQYGLGKIEAEKAWATGTGVGATVAVVDTGADAAHEDLEAKIVAGYDFIQGDETPQDGNSHGTHVSGIAAAMTNNGIGVAGVAPGACVMPVRVLGNDGSGSTSGVSSGIRWAADHGAEVINLSLGEEVVIRNVAGSSVKAAVEYAYGKGVVVAVAGGNDFLFPSGYRDVDAIAVAATDRKDDKASFSNGVGDARYGISAPGDGILSTVPNNGYASYSGTSMATPHVAGAAAVLRSLGLSRDQTIQRLLDTADDVGLPGKDPVFGSGRLNLAKAVEGLKARGGASACRAPSTSGSGSGGGGTSSGGGATGTTKSTDQASQKAGSGTNKKSTSGSSLGDYKDPERKTAVAGEQKSRLSAKTLINIGAAALLLVAGISWYIWHRRRAITEE